MSRIIASLLVIATFLVALPSASAVTIPTVPVGNAPNAADTTGYGAVGNGYRIGTTEVSNSQVRRVLKRQGRQRSVGPFTTGRWAAVSAALRKAAPAPASPYAVIAGRGDMPVNFVSWYDSIRFANWLNNGQGSGDTETGAYTLLGGTAHAQQTGPEHHPQSRRRYVVDDQ